MRCAQIVFAGCLLTGAAGAQAQPGGPRPDDLPPVGDEPQPPDDAMQPDVPDEPPAPPPSASGNADVYAALPPLVLPPVDADTLAFGSSFRIVAATLTASSTGQLSNDVDDESAQYALAVDTRYFRSLEKTGFGYSLLASAGDSLDRVAAPGGSLYTNNLALAGAPEGRLYPTKGSLLFLHVSSDFSMNIFSQKQTGTLPSSDSTAPGAFGVAVGGGFGRVLAIDPVVRLRRLEQSLIARGAIGGPIAQAAGTEIVRIWYALRNDIGLYRTLAYTMKHLQQAGALTGDPDLRATYESLQILGDPFIVDRRMGWDVRGGFGILQPFTGFDDLDEPDAQVALIGSAQWERSLDTTRQLSVRGKALFDIGDSDTGFRPYSLRGFGTYTEVFYGEFQDPLGALSLAGEVGASGTRGPGDDPELGLDLVGRAAYSMALNRGSLATAGLNATIRNDGIYTLTLSLAITWGIAAGYFTLYTPAAAGI